MYRQINRMSQGAQLNGPSSPTGKFIDTIGEYKPFLESLCNMTFDSYAYFPIISTQSKCAATGVIL